MREDVWAERAKGLLKAELKRRNIGYRDLAEKLSAQGTPETERNIANKIQPGRIHSGFPDSMSFRHWMPNVTSRMGLASSGDGDRKFQVRCDCFRGDRGLLDIRRRHHRRSELLHAC